MVSFKLSVAVSSTFSITSSRESCSSSAAKDVEIDVCFDMVLIEVDVNTDVLRLLVDVLLLCAVVVSGLSFSLLSTNSAKLSVVDVRVDVAGVLSSTEAVVRTMS